MECPCLIGCFKQSWTWDSNASEFIGRYPHRFFCRNWHRFFFPILGLYLCTHTNEQHTDEHLPHNGHHSNSTTATWSYLTSRITSCSVGSFSLPHSHCCLRSRCRVSPPKMRRTRREAKSTGTAQRLKQHSSHLQPWSAMACARQIVGQSLLLYPVKQPFGSILVGVWGLFLFFSATPCLHCLQVYIYIIHIIIHVYVYIYITHDNSYYNNHYLSGHDMSFSSSGSLNNLS